MSEVLLTKEQLAHIINGGYVEVDWEEIFEIGGAEFELPVYVHIALAPPTVRKGDKIMEDKVILDACCGGRQFWFDKEEQHTVFMDIRQVDKGTIEMQPNFSISPDVIGDYRDMPFPDKSFKLVVWDIPHIVAKRISGVITTKYGILDKETWREDLQAGFSEIMRVLDDYGVLTFKYADISIPVKTVLELFPIKPLYGTITKKGTNNTYWFTFMKMLHTMPEAVDNILMED